MLTVKAIAATDLSPDATGGRCKRVNNRGNDVCGQIFPCVVVGD
jgi:hypothetical protein